MTYLEGLLEEKGMRGIIDVIESVTRDGILQDYYDVTLSRNTVQGPHELESGSGSGPRSGSSSEFGPGSGIGSCSGPGPKAHSERESPGSLFDEIGWLERLNAVTDAYHWLLKSKYLTPQQIFSSPQLEVEVEVVIKAERGSKRKASVLSASSSASASAEGSFVPEKEVRHSSSDSQPCSDSESDARPRIFKFLRNFMDACHVKMLKGDIA